MPTINMEKTGENIRTIAKEAGMTMKDVADMCGVTPQAAAKWGRTCMPTIDAIVVMACTWKVRMEDIVAVVEAA